MAWNMGSLVSGMIFGSGLTLSGVASPQIIRDQFKLSDMHMLVTFLTASASSAALIAMYNHRSKHEPIPPRSHSSLGWVGKYDGNVIGGALVGLGMVLTGACPGTVLVQATAGVGRSRLLMFSALVAGVAFTKCKRWIYNDNVKPIDRTNDTVMSVTGWSAGRTIVTYELAMVVAIAMALTLGYRSDALVHPIVGGLLIGIGQLSSILMVKKPVGVSAVYGDVANIATDLVNGTKPQTLPNSVVFAAGITAGAGLTMLSVPATLEALAGSEAPSVISTLVGGAALVFGARVAGGCTSGHGISGMAGMGVSSFITVMSMFGTGILSSFLLR